MMVHAFNLSYSGGGDKRLLSLRLAQAKRYGDPVLKPK
jgi:hypothetical protein